MASLSFNSAEVEPQAEFQPLPAASYNAVAVSSEVKITKTGGEMVVYKMQVIDGPYANRTVFARLNVRNDNAEAERIGRSQLSAFCRAVGVTELTDTDELLNKPVLMRLKIRDAQNGYPASNEVAGFAPAGSAPTPQTAQPAPTRPAPPAAAAPGRRPWESKAA